MSMSLLKLSSFFVVHKLHWVYMILYSTGCYLSNCMFYVLLIWAMTCLNTADLQVVVPLTSRRYNVQWVFVFGPPFSRNNCINKCSLEIHMQLSNYELVNAMLMVILSTNIVNIYLRTRYTLYLFRPTRVSQNQEPRQTNAAIASFNGNHWIYRRNLISDTYPHTLCRCCIWYVNRKSPLGTPGLRAC